MQIERAKQWLLHKERTFCAVASMILNENVQSPQGQMSNRFNYRLFTEAGEHQQINATWRIDLVKNVVVNLKTDHAMHKSLLSRSTKSI